MNDISVTVTGEAAMTIKYAIALARLKSKDFDGMTDEEVLSALIEIGLDGKEDVQE